jgi:RNA polymerase sigma factor (sigma-70 family)
MEYRRRNKYAGKEISYDNFMVDTEEDNISYLDVIADCDDIYDYYDILDTIATELTQEEKEILYLSANKYKQGEIADLYHTSQSNVSRKVNKIRDKLRTILY